MRARFRGNLLLVSAPVKLEGKQIATLHVLSDYRSVYVPMVNLVLCLLLLVAAALVAVAVLLSSRLQRFLSEPILRLADTARRVANQADYSVRAQEEDGEEFGVLTRAFNQMLARIQAQDAALTASQRKTETLIHSIDGVVWERAPEAARFLCQPPVGESFWLRSRPMAGQPAILGTNTCIRMTRRPPSRRAGRLLPLASPIARNTVCGPRMGGRCGCGKAARSWRKTAKL